MCRKAAVGLLIASFVLLAGCKTPQVKELDADMPTAIVKQYAESDKPYVDRGFFWVPCIKMRRMHVSKTAGGYHATGHFATGPLGVLVLGKESSDFDDQGQLLQYSARVSCLWGILLCDNSCREYDQAEENWSRQWSRKILFGLLGYEGNSHHWRAFYLLYVPIVTSHGNRHKWRQERSHENGDEQEREERAPGPPERRST